MSLTITPAQIVERAEMSGHPGLLARVPSWPRTRLGDLARVVNGAPFPSAQFNTTGEGWPLVRIRDVGANDTATYFDGEFDDSYIVNRGDLLIGMDGDFRIARWLGRRSLLNQRVCRLDVTSDSVLDSWLEHVLPGYLDAIEQHTSSITVKHLSSKTVCDIPIPLPSIEEQRRIVDILEDHLSRLDAAESQMRASIARLNVLDRLLIEHAILGVGQPPVGGTGSLPSAGTDDGKLADLPKGWAWQRLGAIADVVGGVTKDAKKQSDPSYVEVPYLRVANVQRGSLDLSVVTTIRVPPERAMSLRLVRGDVLLNEGGDRDKLGRGWVWDDQVKNCIHQNHVFRARVRDDVIKPHLLSWAANTIGGPWCERNGKQSVNLASISLSRIKLMPIPVAPRHLQERLREHITDGLETNQRLAAALQLGLERAVTLRRTLLQAAFSGRLTARSSDIDRIKGVVPPVDRTGAPAVPGYAESSCSPHRGGGRHERAV